MDLIRRSLKCRNLCQKATISIWFKGIVYVKVTKHRKWTLGKEGVLTNMQAYRFKGVRYMHFQLTIYRLWHLLYIANGIFTFNSRRINGKLWDEILTVRVRVHIFRVFNMTDIRILIHMRIKDPPNMMFQCNSL